ncbi:MAG: hypothetical protein AAFX99_09265, partial [Myxococcota bacterium]
GTTFADMRLEGRSLPLERMSGGSWYLGARVNTTLVAGLYTGIDVRWLRTWNWRNSAHHDQILSEFNANPFWGQLCLGYRLTSRR